MADSKRKQISKPLGKQHVKVSNQPVIEDKIERDEQDVDVANNFEMELAWCIQELKLGLCNYSGSKSDVKKAEDAVKALKILESNSAPLPKKRCVMKATFGDYRKKMEASRKISESAWKNSKIACIQPESASSSKFLRKCSSQSPNIVSASDASDSKIQKNVINKISTDNEDNNQQMVKECDGTQIEPESVVNRTISAPFVFGFDIDSSS